LNADETWLELAVPGETELVLGADVETVQAGTYRFRRHA